MIDDKLIDVVRSKYQYEMKNSLFKINKILSTPNSGDEDDIDFLLDSFMKAKDKAGYFEGILKNLNKEENEQ